jgi:hypothetical protein
MTSEAFKKYIDITRALMSEGFETKTFHTSFIIKKNRLQKIGVNKNTSNFFIFELDNNIFTYSSKDRDFFKTIKFNNVISPQ